MPMAERNPVFHIPITVHIDHSTNFNDVESKPVEDHHYGDQIGSGISRRSNGMMVSGVPQSPQPESHERADCGDDTSSTDEEIQQMNVGIKSPEPASPGSYPFKNEEETEQTNRTKQGVVRRRRRTLSDGCARKKALSISKSFREYDSDNVADESCNMIYIPISFNVQNRFVESKTVFEGDQTTFIDSNIRSVILQKTQPRSRIEQTDSEIAEPGGKTTRLGSETSQTDARPSKPTSIRPENESVLSKSIAYQPHRRVNQPSSSSNATQYDLLIDQCRPGPRLQSYRNPCQHYEAVQNDPRSTEFGIGAPQIGGETSQHASETFPPNPESAQCSPEATQLVPRAVLPGTKLSQPTSKATELGSRAKQPGSIASAAHSGFQSTQTSSITDQQSCDPTQPGLIIAKVHKAPPSLRVAQTGTGVVHASSSQFQSGSESSQLDGGVTQAGPEPSQLRLGAVQPSPRAPQSSQNAIQSQTVLSDPFQLGLKTAQPSTQTIQSGSRAFRSISADALPHGYGLAQHNPHVDQPGPDDVFSQEVLAQICEDILRGVHRIEEKMSMEDLAQYINSKLLTEKRKEYILLKGGSYYLETLPIKPYARVHRGHAVIGSDKVPVVGKMIQSLKEHDEEIKILVGLQCHNNVVQVKSTAEDSSHHSYIILEACNENTLQDIMACGHYFDLQQMWKYTKDLVKGMKFIHNKKIIHGDLKPENILFSTDMKRLKIGDFGLSIQLHYGRSKASNRKAGTDGWRAPETYTYERIDLKSDIFSLGLVFYFIWSNGKHPFGSDVHDWCYNIKNNLKLDLSQLLIPDDESRNKLLALLKDMLAFDRKIRPTMQEIFDHEFFKGDPPSPVSEIFKEIMENLSAPVSRAEYVESGECEVDIMGCKVKFEDYYSKETAIVYVGVKPMSDDVPKGQFAISPEVECKIFQSSCKRQVTISLPLHAIPNDKNIRVLGKANGSLDWKDLGVSSVGRSYKFQPPPFKSIRVVATCSQIQTTLIRHCLYFNGQQLCSIVSIDNEALIKRCDDIFRRSNFEKTSELISIPRLNEGEQIMYHYESASPVMQLPSDRKIILGANNFVEKPIYCEPMWLPQKQEIGHLQISVSSPQILTEKLTPPKVHTDSKIKLTKLPLLKRSTEEFYIKKNSSKDNYYIHPDGPKGMTLIINNEMKKHRHRKGSRKDMKIQVALWKDLGFDVVPKINLTTEDMRKACQDFSTTACENHASIVVVVIMTHGRVENGKEAFAGEDAKCIYLEEVVRAFNKDDLKGIPKLFMFQACRYTLSNENLQPVSNDDADAGNEVSKITVEEDMIFAYPCRMGESAHRARITGSFMMNAVAKVFMQNAHNTHVLDMLTKVNDVVSGMEKEDRKGELKMQRSCQRNLARKNLYLFPGWPKISE